MPNREVGGSRKNRWKRIGRAAVVVAGLTLLFAADDWLLILLVEQLQLRSFPMLAYVGAGLAVTLTNGLLALAVYKVLRRKPVSGIEGLVGETAVALEDFRNEGLVSVHGETWTAEMEGRAKKGDRLVVEGVEGLRVQVRPAEGRPRRSGSARN